MPDDILRTLDGLDALMSDATPAPWKKERCPRAYTRIVPIFGEASFFVDGKTVKENGIKSDVDAELIVFLVNNAAAISSALRRAMAVVNGLREMDVAVPSHAMQYEHEMPEDWPWELLSGAEQQVRVMRGKACHGMSELWRSKRDRLLSENGFNET